MGQTPIRDQMREPLFTDGEILFYNTEENHCWVNAHNRNNVVKVFVVGNNTGSTSCKIKVKETFSEKYPVGKEMDVSKSFLLTNENFQLWIYEVLP